MSIVRPAELDWQLIDGIEIPVSRVFKDVYFSKDNGLLETRHVFLNGNDLESRLSELSDFEYFCVGELGFGTGLNVLALWQLWQRVRPNNQSHLHVISFEKYPLTHTDLKRALQAWPELFELSQQLIAQYPLPITGCHRLRFDKAQFSIDLWLGDANEVLPKIKPTLPVKAWFLDGFSPACNPELWQQQILDQVIRLSAPGSSFASFSVAGVLKRGLEQHGIEINKPRGFGHKREMLKAKWPTSSDLNVDPLAQFNTTAAPCFAIIGAGIAGLTLAWTLAERGHRVQLFEQSHPLSGASGNPLALLNPKLAVLDKADQHLMTQSWQYALRFYAQFEAFRLLDIEQIALKAQEQDMQAALLADYPEEIIQAAQSEQNVVGHTYPAIRLALGAAISPQALADQIMAHPLISIQKLAIDRLEEHPEHVLLYSNDHAVFKATQVIVCAALNTETLLKNLPRLKAIRGQVSWFNTPVAELLWPNRALSYGGYCTALDQKQLILGASFHPDDNDTNLTPQDHTHNLTLLKQISADFAAQLPNIETWQGRAAVRAQSLDYLPLIGLTANSTRCFSFSGLGSKGFLFAPLCSEILASELLKEHIPVTASLRQKLEPKRFKPKTKAAT